MVWKDVLARLRKAEPGELAAIARATGVSYSIVWRIAAGETRDPRIGTVERISAYYNGKRRAA